MAKEQWDDREVLRAFFAEVREEASAGSPLKTIAAGVVERLEKRREMGRHEHLDLAWARAARERDVTAVYEDLRAMELTRNQIYAKAENTPDAPVVRLSGTQGLKNADTGEHERPATRTIGFKQFEQYRARQLRLFATEVEKQKWIERVWEFWKAHEQIETLEAVCKAAGIPFEPAFAAEMA